MKFRSQKRAISFVVPIIVACALCGGANVARAQFTTNFQTNTINGVHSNWVQFGYVVGSNTFKDVLRVINGGVLSNHTGFIGFETKGSNNVALVSDAGSIWSNAELAVGWLGGGNSLIISNGGAVTVVDTSTLGSQPGIGNNVAIVTGAGSSWTTLNMLNIGDNAPGNQLIVTNGGTVISSGTLFGGTIIGNGTAGIQNAVTVTGTGSVFSVNGLVMGQFGGENTMHIDNGGKMNNSAGSTIMGLEISSSNNTVTVSGAGSVWDVPSFYIGYASRSNVVTIAGGSVLAGSAFIGYSDPSFGSASNNVLKINSGSLFVTNAAGKAVLVVSKAGGKGNLIINGGSVTVDSFIATNGLNSVIALNGGTLTTASALVANGQDFVVGAASSNATYIPAGAVNTFNNSFVVRRGALLLNGGTVTVNQLDVTNGATGVVTFDSGGLNSAGTFVTNTQEFVVGNGAAGAEFRLLGGVHSFNNGLRIRNASTLTGCGTVNGNVTVDAGGTVLADCGTMTFTGTVTNNWALAADGAALEFNGTVVNNGGILLYNGGTVTFNGTFINNGIISNAGPVVITSVTRLGDDIVVQAPSTNGFRYQLQFTASVIPAVWTNSGIAQAGTGSILTFTDPGGATNDPSRFYQVDVIWP